MYDMPRKSGQRQVQIPKEWYFHYDFPCGYFAYIRNLLDSANGKYCHDSKKMSSGINSYYSILKRTFIAAYH